MRTILAVVIALTMAPVVLAREVSAQSDTPTRRAEPSIETLPPAVKAVVEIARENARLAAEAAMRARATAALGEQAALAAWGGRTGTRVKTQPDGKTYAQEWRISSQNGHGVVTFDLPHLGAGDRFAGYLVGAEYTGEGVYTFADNPNNIGRAEKYEGQFLASGRSGYGVYRWKSGVQVAGKWLVDAQVEAGVLTYADGRRYEGELLNLQPSGPGAMWYPDGRVLAGRWALGEYAGAATP